MLNLFGVRQGLSVSPWLFCNCIPTDLNSEIHLSLPVNKKPVPPHLAQPLIGTRKADAFSSGIAWSCVHVLVIV